MLLNEGALVAAARRGDTAAFRALVEHYERPVYGFLYRVVGDQELARDLAQDTFLTVYQALARLKGEAGFRPWLYKIALNLARHALRRRRLIAWLPWTPHGDTPATAFDTSVDAQMVHEALAALPSDLRVPLVLRLVQGFSYAEIGAIMGVSEGAVKMRVLRARRMFRDVYQAMEADEPLKVEVGSGGRG